MSDPRNEMVVKLKPPSNASRAEVVGKPANTLYEAFGGLHEGIREENFVHIKISPISEMAELQSPPFAASYAGAAHKSFKEHKAFRIRPDDFHILIVQGISRFFQLYPQDFREFVVSFNGKRKLVHDGSLYPGCPMTDWNELAEDFAKLIREASKNKLFIDAITQGYSQSTDLDKQIKAVTLMATFSPFFCYEERTMCFIPEFILEGTEADWKQLLELPDQILNSLSPSQDDKQVKPKPRAVLMLTEWLTNLKNRVLKECYAARQGKVNENFWRSFYKYESGSGGTFITGYINHFYPFVNNIGERGYENNRFVLNTSSSTPEQLPANVVDVDFVWNYSGTKYEMGMTAGFGPIMTDAKTGVSPLRFMSIYHKGTLPKGHVNFDGKKALESSKADGKDIGIAVEAKPLSKEHVEIRKKVAQLIIDLKDTSDCWYSFTQLICCGSGFSRQEQIVAAENFLKVLRGELSKAQANLDNYPVLKTGELGKLYAEYMRKVEVSPTHHNTTAGDRTPLLNSAAAM